MSVERCPKCKAAATLPMVYTVIIDQPYGTDEGLPTMFCLSCRYRWHSRLRFHLVH